MCVTNTINRRPRAIAFKGCQVEPPTSNVATSSHVNGFAVASMPQQISNEFPSTFPVYNNASNSVGVFNVNSSFDWRNHSALSMANQYNFQNQQPNVKPARPKRRRKPQKPGKTAKMNDRHFVVHNYHDHANDQPDETDVQEESQPSRRRGGVSLSFPLKLHAMLDQIEADGLAHVISWQSHGRAFLVHKPQEFVSHVMPTYFRQTKLTSFQRQLNLYGFCRLTRGNDNRGYYHELFLRGKPFLCKKMSRTKVKGTKFKAASSPDAEPDFYKMAPVVITPPTSGASDHETTDSDSVDTFTMPSPLMMQSPVASFDAIPTAFYQTAIMSPMSPLPVKEIQQPMMYQEPPPPIPSLYQNQQTTAVSMMNQEPISSDEEEHIDDELLNALGMEHDFVQTWGKMTAAADAQSVGSFDAEEILEEGTEISDDYQLGCLLQQFLTE